MILQCALFCARTGLWGGHTLTTPSLAMWIVLWSGVWIAVWFVERIVGETKLTGK